MAGSIDASQYHKLGACGREADGELPGMYLCNGKKAMSMCQGKRLARCISCPSSSPFPPEQVPT